MAQATDTWPFEVVVSSRALSSDESVVVSADLRLPDESQELERRLCDVFALGSFGALSGHIAPWESTCCTEQVSRTETRLVIEARTRVADEVYVMLANAAMAAYARVPISRLAVVSRSGAGQIMRRSASQVLRYPVQYECVPFQLHDEIHGESCEIRVELNDAVGIKSEWWMNNFVDRWRACVLCGGYAVPGLSPEHCYVELNECRVTVYDSMIEWSVEKLRADPACVNGLVNGLIAFDRVCQGVKSVVCE